jgi:Ca2+-binding RTX toxin-like protein
LGGYGLSVTNNGQFNVERMDLVLRTASGVNTMSYEYISNDQQIEADIAGSFSLRLDGQGVKQDPFYFGQITWGAGQSTQIMGIETDGNLAFFAPVRGDSIPQLSADGGHVMIEFFTMADLSGTSRNISSGPFQPGQNFSLNAVFDDNTSGFIKKGTQSADKLSGGSGDNVIVGQRGGDNIAGNGGRDTLLLGRGDDKGYGGGGGDVISGYFGDDTIYGGRGDDKLLGMVDRDTIYGGKNDDNIRGGFGADKLFGGDGKDRITGDEGNDIMNGGGGADKFVFRIGHGDDTVRGFKKGADKLLLNDNLWFGEELTKQQVVDFFADKSGGEITFNFDTGDTILLEDYGSLTTLADQIQFI